MLSTFESPRSDDPKDVADWLELQLLIGESWSVTETNALGFLAQSGLEGAYGSSVSGAINVIQRRVKRLGLYYPIVRRKGAMHRVGVSKNNRPYVCLLALSLVDREPSIGQANDCGQLFERLCAVFLPFVGGSGIDHQVVHFGWPSEHGRPESFPEAIRWLADKMGLKVGDGYRSPRNNDGGVDLVSWRVAGSQTIDHRLVQCTVGTELVRKAQDVQLHRWTRWITFPGGEPQRGLLVPYQINKSSVDAREASALGGLVLDRVDLIQLIDGDELETIDKLCIEILRQVEHLDIAVEAQI
jgi:hypothetical protein